MFSTSYIKKCKDVKDKIFYLLSQARCPFREGESIEPKVILMVGDYFHHAESMKGEEVRVVKETRPDGSIFSDDPRISYPEGECVLIPTVNQLRKGLEAVNRFLADDDFEHGEEYLLDKIIESQIKPEA